MTVCAGHNGSMGADEKTIALAGVDPALEGNFTVDGVEVTTVFERVKAEAAEAGVKGGGISGQGG